RMKLSRQLFVSSLGISISLASSMMAAGQQQVLSDDSLDSVIAASPLLSLHRSLCEIEGISDHEQGVGDFLTTYLTSHNFTVEKQVVPFDEESDEAASPR